MNVRTLTIPDLLVVEPDVFRDSRGWFCEQYNERKYTEAGITPRFVQDNESLSSRGVIRGLHWQADQHCQAKLVRVIRGAVWDIAVDIRKGSPTYGRWDSVYLYAPDSEFARSGRAIRDLPYSQFFIPRGFAHGFITLEDNTLFSYKCDNLYNKDSERGLLFSDPSLGVTIPDIGVPFILSPKDRCNPCLRDIEPYDWGLL